jgi:hypothetical protein
MPGIGMKTDGIINHMGYLVELNTLIGLPEDFDPAVLAVGKRFTINKPRERAFPLHLAMLIVDGKWNFYGYGVATQIIVIKDHTEIVFEVLTLFNEQEKNQYKLKFIEAAKKTGEVK